MTVASFVFSAVALGLSGSAFGWQLLSWFLTGGRIEVEFLTGAVGRGGIIVMPNLDREQISQLRHQGYQDVVGVIEVHNKGRMPVFVQQVGVEAGEVRFMETEPLHGPALPYKLEAGERATWAMHGWNVENTRASAEIIGRPAEVKAFARLASGKKQLSARAVDVREALAVPPSRDKSA